jgi:hypothetical protein
MVRLRNEEHTCSYVISTGTRKLEMSLSEAAVWVYVGIKSIPIGPNGFRFSESKTLVPGNFVGVYLVMVGIDAIVIASARLLIPAVILRNPVKNCFG